MIPGIVAQRWFHPQVAKVGKAISTPVAYGLTLDPFTTVSLGRAGDFTSMAFGMETMLVAPFSSVVLLIGADTSVVDESSFARTLTANGNAQRTTTNPKFGAGAMLFDGAGDFYSFPLTSDFDFSGGAFTIEGFVRPSSTTGTILSIWSSTTSNNLFAFWRNAGVLTFSWINTLGARRDITYTDSMVNGTWYHVAVTMSPTDNAGNFVTRMRVNGVMVYVDTRVASDRPRTTTGSTALPRLGGLNGFTTADWNGAMDEIRVTKGFDQYNTNSNIVVPTSAFPRS